LVWRHRAQNVGVDEVNHLLDDLRIKIADFIRLFVSTVPFEKGPEDGRLVGQNGPVAVNRSFVVVRVTIIICPGPLVHSMGKMSWRNGNGEEGLISTYPGCAASNCHFW
jgi:hypothetical protein